MPGPGSGRCAARRLYGRRIVCQKESQPCQNKPKRVDGAVGWRPRRRDNIRTYPHGTIVVKYTTPEDSIPIQVLVYMCRVKPLLEATYRTYTSGPAPRPSARFPLLATVSLPRIALSNMSLCLIFNAIETRLKLLLSQSIQFEEHRDPNLIRTSMCAGLRCLIFGSGWGSLVTCPLATVHLFSFRVSSATSLLPTVLLFNLETIRPCNVRPQIFASSIVVKETH